MIGHDEELASKYLAECREHLTATDADLLTIGRGGAEIDEELVNQVYWTVHSVRAAGFFGLVQISELAYQTEEVLALIRSRKMPPTSHRVRVLLRATARLSELIQNPATSNQVDISEIVAALERLRTDHLACAVKGDASRVDQAHQDGRRLRVLLVEDEFVSRLLLQTFLSRYGECRYAANGRDGVEAFRSALERGQTFDLICLDIMMPELDGREALRQMRALEKAHGIHSTGARIIMTTTMNEVKEVIQCFQFCDSYLTKPIDLTELLSQMKSYQLIQ